MKDILALVSNTADAVCAVDRDHRIVFWNDAAATLLGLKADDVLGRSCAEVIAGRDRSGRLVCNAHCDSMLRALSQELVPTYDLVVRTQAGRELVLNVGTIVVPSKWRDLFVLVHLFRDVTREKEVGHVIHQLLSNVAKLSSAPGTEPLIRPTLSPASIRLTDREREVLRLLAAGASNKAVAKQLFISPSTVRNHIHNILTKLNVHSRLEAVTLALRSGLI